MADTRACIECGIETCVKDLTTRGTCPKCWTQTQRIMSPCQECAKKDGQIEELRHQLDSALVVSINTSGLELSNWKTAMQNRIVRVEKAMTRLANEELFVTEPDSPPLCEACERREALPPDRILCSVCTKELEEAVKIPMTKEEEDEHDPPTI